MKSVSFSDLRDSSEMNNFDSNIKKSSSIKQLTYYSSSEDVLRRFSTKTADKFLGKESQKIEESKSEAITKTIEPIFQEVDEYKADVSAVNHEKTIKELRDQLKQKSNAIANLQDENLLLKTESTKNKEQVKFLENRIKYLENLVDTFNTNSQSKIRQTAMENEKPDKENNDKTMSYTNSQTSVKPKPFNSIVNFNESSQVEESKYLNYTYSKTPLHYEYGPNQERTTDLRKRPNSADSTLQNNYPNLKASFEDDPYKPSRKYSVKPYDSDSEPRRSSKHLVNNHENTLQSNGISGSGPNNFVHFQSPKLEKERSLNLSEFKSRLDEFTNYARKSVEQNTLRNSASTLPIPNEYKAIPKSSINSDKWTQDLNTKNRMKSSTQFSRPPIDPYYKQRRQNNPEPGLSLNEPTINYSSMNQSQNMIEEDAFLKDRVKKILEKHNYPVNNSYYANTGDIMDNTGYRNELTNMQSNKKYGSSDNSKPVDRHYSKPSLQYGLVSNGKVSSNSSNIPKLDLTLHNQPPYYTDDTSDLLEKYLNYQGHTHVS